jgi:glycosyltransferase involved in cell wall biosynthesis
MRDVQCKKPLISVVVATYNGEKQLYECVKALSRCPGPEFEIIIADDGSSERKTSEVIRRLTNEIPQRVVHACQENCGFRLARSRNHAVQFSAGELLIFLDHDIIVPRGFLQGITTTLRTGWYLAGRRVKLDAETSHEILGVERDPDSVFDWKFAMYAMRKRLPGWRYLFPLRNRGPGLRSQSWKGMSGFCLVLEREAFDTVDGFDGIYREYGAEDWDFLVRLSNAGLRGGYLPRSCTVAHLWHSETPIDPNCGNYELLNETISARRVRAMEGYSTLGASSQMDEKAIERERGARIKC